jgi:hypothetical protein
LFGYSSCEKNKKFEYEILKNSKSQNLVFVDNGSSDILGIDTVTFTLEVHLRVSNMITGGVCQLPKGGIAFTYNSNSNNKRGNELYVTDENYNIVDKYSVCVSPMAPKVINNILLVGSSVFEQNGKMKFQLYNTDNFALIQEHSFEDMIDAWKIAAYNTYAYFGIDISPPYIDRQDGYIVELDLATQKLKEISFSSNAFFKQDDAYSLCRNGSLLYVFQRTKKNLCIIDLNTNSIDTIVPTGSYPEIVAIDAWNIAHPIVIGNYIYAFLSLPPMCYWVKFNASTFNLENIKEIKVSYGAGPASQFIAGRFLVTSAEKRILFIDVESGEVVNEHRY